MTYGAADANSIVGQPCHGAARPRHASRVKAQEWVLRPARRQGCAGADLRPNQSATLSWNVQAPANCGALRVEVEGLAVNRTGSRKVWGIERSSFVDFAAGKLSTRYMLRVVFGSASRPLAYTGVKVSLPVDPATGNAVVPISANHHQALSSWRSGRRTHASRCSRTSSST
jgi:hypothetical protein